MSVAQVTPFPSQAERPAFPSGPGPALRAVNPAGPPPKLLDRVRQALLTLTAALGRPMVNTRRSETEEEWVHVGIW